LLSHIPEELDSIAEWLQSKPKKRVEMKIPVRGSKKALLELARTNSTHALKQNLLQSRRGGNVTELLEKVKTDLALSSPPHKIYGYDISNLGETNAVASQVTFVDGRPAKQLYRRYTITRVVGQDDFAMMGEVLRRSFVKVKEGEMEKPDLVVIDGGKGQLHASLRSISKLGYENQEICAISKGEEKIILPGMRESLLLPDNSPTLHLIQRIRDESHRFAHSYHSKLRRRDMLQSSLDEIPGIGDVRKQILLEHFNSIEEVKEASLEALTNITNVGEKTACAIYSHFHPPSSKSRE
jgi:excinuclease ABC subunit C